MDRKPTKQRSQAAKRGQSIDEFGSREASSIKPMWITDEEKAKLRARLHRMKSREQRLKLKEDAVLLQQAERTSKDSSPSPIPIKGRKASDLSTVASEDGTDHPKGKKRSKSKDSSKKQKNAVKAEKKQSKEDVKLNKRKSKDSMKAKKSKDSLKAKKSKDSLKGKKSRDSMKAEKSKDSMKPKKSRDSITSNKSKGSMKAEKSKESVKALQKKEKEEKKAKQKNMKERSNPSGNTMAPQPEREMSRTDLNEHLWATDYKKFDPQLYHFKSPDKLSTKNPVLAECPPFWVLLDHTIAVIWKLFCPQANRQDLGIIPLQWSREFVSAMRDERGEYLPVIAQVLSAIEDALIDRYAKAAEIEKTCNTDAADKEKCAKKDQDSISYVSSESIFKHPMEVSYTLKDIMSRNLPGRMAARTKDGGVVCHANPAIRKVDVPPPDEKNMSQSDMLSYLRQLKQEQEARVAKEKEHSDKIAALMDLVANGKLDGNAWFEGHETKGKPNERVSFREKEEEREESRGSSDSRGSDSGGKEKKPKKGKQKKSSKTSVEEPKQSQKSKKPKKSKDSEPKKPKKVKGEKMKKKKSDSSLRGRSSQSSQSSEGSNKSKTSTASKGSKKKKKSREGSKTSQKSRGDSS